MEMLLAHLGILLVGFRRRAFAADMDVQLAEIAREAPVLLQVDRLLAEEDDAVPAERILQSLHLLGRERLPEVDADDLRPDMR